MTGGPEGPTTANIVSVAGLAVALITAWLYAAGWGYAYTYFDRFHIPLLMLDVPFEHMLVYGGLAVQRNIWLALVYCALQGAALWAFARWAALLGRFAVTAFVIVLLVITFSLARVAGNSAAWADFREQRASDYRAYPRVQLRWSGSGDPSGKVLSDIVTTDCGRLLVVSKERLFLIRSLRGASGAELATFVIDSKNVQAMRISGDYTSCDD